MSATRPEQLYKSDFYAWTQAQARELRRFARTRPNAPLDLAHIAEEIQDLGKSERDAVFSLSQQILQHFLLIEHSPAVEQRPHWMDEIDEFRTRIKRKLSPTIRRHLKRELPELYVRRSADRSAQDASSWRSAGGRLSTGRMPLLLEQVLGDWLPGDGALESGLNRDRQSGALEGRCRRIEQIAGAASLVRRGWAKIESYVC